VLFAQHLSTNAKQHRNCHNPAQPSGDQHRIASTEGRSPMSNTLTVKTDVGDIEVRENELTSITDKKLKQMGMSLPDLHWCFIRVKWLANIGRRAVAYRKPDGGLLVQGVKLD
jgi:hypothetical protein